ncbi:MAG: T9SS type A sorting domain-containing protein [Bacteroidia bacterium]
MKITHRKQKRVKNVSFGYEKRIKKNGCNWQNSVQRTTYNVQCTTYSEKLDISHLSKGVYYLKVSFENGSVNYTKVVKQ